MAADGISEAYSECMFLRRASEFVPLKDDACILDPKAEGYQDKINSEIEKFSAGDPSSMIYLGLQPIWCTRTWRLSGLEILARAKNGQDAAPMPGLAIFQATQKEADLRFLKTSCDFAVRICRRLPPSVAVNLNVRPDELSGAKEFIIAAAASVPNIIFEITEYCPIDGAVIALLREMKTAGVKFAIDDVTEVIREGTPGKGFALADKHACSFAVATEHADLFSVQKLALPLSVCIYRVDVFVTPQYAGGSAHGFFKSLIFDPSEEAEILLRKELVESWVANVKAKNPDARFVIEASVYPEDVNDKPSEIAKGFPNIGLFEGPFSIQGGKSGGRAFTEDFFASVGILN
jgi:hypothetical protein